MFQKMHLTITSAATAVAILFCPVASAGPIDPGFDLFHTQSATLDLSSFGMGLGLTEFESVVGGPGNTDTIIKRKPPFLPPGGTGTIDVEIVALQLRSVAPVDLGGTLHDIDIRLDLNFARPSLGEYDMLAHDETPGGTYNSFFDVFVELDFFEVSNPGNMFSLLGMDRFASDNDPWSHMPPPLYPEDGALPPGGFYPDAVTYSSDLSNGGTGLFNSLRLTPAIPEPNTLALFALGLAGLGFARRRKAA